MACVVEENKFVKNIEGKIKSVIIVFNEHYNLSKKY